MISKKFVLPKNNNMLNNMVIGLISITSNLEIRYSCIIYWAYFIRTWKISIQIIIQVKNF